MRLIQIAVGKVLRFGGKIKKIIFSGQMAAENGDHLQTEAGENIITEGI